MPRCHYLFPSLVIILGGDFIFHISYFFNFTSLLVEMIEFDYFFKLVEQINYRRIPRQSYKSSCVRSRIVAVSMRLTLAMKEAQLKFRECWGVLSASSIAGRVLFWCGYFTADDRIHMKWLMVSFPGVSHISPWVPSASVTSVVLNNKIDVQSLTQ